MGMVMLVRRLPAIGLLLLAAACGSGAGWKRPNVLLYVVDTLRADEIGAYGQKVVQTPSFDALATEGVLFERTYAPSSWTRASLSTVLTGLDPRHHGVRGRTRVLAPQIETLAERFRRAGYATGAIVANPNIGSAFGFDQGWEPVRRALRAARARARRVRRAGRALRGGH
jgi:arylsulfatase A-like enzyme